MYAKRSGKDAAEIGAMLDAVSWMAGQTAVDEGFADAINTLQIPGCQPFQGCFQPFQYGHRIAVGPDFKGVLFMQLHQGTGQPKSPDDIFILQIASFLLFLQR